MGKSLVLDPACLQRSPRVSSGDFAPGTPDGIYACEMGKRGLYGKAFFGHRASPKERAEMRRIWNAILRWCKPTGSDSYGRCTPIKSRPATFPFSTSV